jgi:hypothetical protein
MSVIPYEPNNTLTTYDPKLVTVIFGGVPISGFADGTFVSIEPTSDRYSRVVGADGEVSRSKSVDNSHTVTITLMQSSASNQYLSLLLQIDEITNKSVLPLEVIDSSGTTMYHWPQAYIAKSPSWGYGKENTDRAWELQTGQASIANQGGTIIGIEPQEDGTALINENEGHLPQAE